MESFKAISKTILFVLALAVGAVIAAGTPAGTEIRNQASASYIDSAGQPQTTTSNEVITVVQPVYGLEIKPDGADEDNPGQIKDMLAAGTVYFNWTVKNTGNTTDTFDLTYLPQGTSDNFDFDVQGLYLDENCNGQIDPGEAPVSSVSLAADETACVIMEAKIDGSASGGDFGNIDLTGTSATDNTVTDSDNWARAVVTEEAILDASKSASPSSDVVPGDAISYTIQGANIGGSAARAVSAVVTVDNDDKDGLLLTDSIPANTTYVANSASGTAGAGTATVIYQTASGWTASEPAAADVTAIGLLIEGSGAFFPQGAQYQLGFQVIVNDGTPAGTDIPNAAVMTYGTGGGTKTTDSNTTHNKVAPVFGVANGPNGDPDADGNGFDNSYTDPAGETWNYDHGAANDNDYERITDDVYGGDTVFFKNTLQNTGNGEDSYDLVVSGVPAGWTCQLMAADGTTPLANPVGPVEPYDPNDPANHPGTFDYVVKCSIPATTTTQNETDLTITATSKGDPTVSDTTHDVIPAVQSGYAVDVAKDNASGDNNSNNDNPDGQSVNPGTTAYYGFEVANTGQNPDTYDLTTAVTGIPGATTTIYPDPDCDGVLDNPAPAPVSDTGLIEDGQKKCFVLAVDVPDGSTPTSQDFNDPTDDNVTITATSTADPTVTDTITTDLEVNLVGDVAFTPDRNGTVTSPGTIVYTHTVTNNGNADASVTFSENGSTHPTWTYQISTDGGNTWSSIGSAQPITIAPGGSQEVQIRVIVPDGEPIGAIDTNQITASGSYSANGLSASDSESVTDTTTVVGGDLRLEKSARTCELADCSGANDPVSNDGSQAKPGEYIEYTIVATNIGTADLKKVIVSDPLPSYTDFVSVDGATSVSGAQVMFSTDGSSWSPNAPTTLDTGEAVYLALDANADGAIDDSDLLPPSETLTMIFVVRVQ